MSALLTASGLLLPGRLAETDLTLEAELTCLIGPNGSGKTSLLHALAGIGSSAGEVRIDGVDPRRAEPAQRQRLLSFLPATRDIRWPLLARDLIALGGGIADEELVTELDLGALIDRRVDRMSTGERSRVVIARALAARPRLVLLDEPAANLDPLWQLRLMDYLRSLTRDEGRIVLAAVHDLDLALRFANRLLVMNDGKIVADGGPGDLLGGPQIGAVFGVERGPDGWQPLKPQAGPRSSP